MGTATKTIEHWQRKRIYALAGELGMTTASPTRDDDLHTLLLGMIGDDSLKSMVYSDASKVIGELEHRNRFGSPPAPKPSSITPSKPGGVSEGQQRKIIALMCELRKVDKVPSTATIEQRVAGIIGKELGITATSKSPYAWLTYKDGVKLIEIIKGYLSGAQKQAVARGEPRGK